MKLTFVQCRDEERKYLCRISLMCFLSVVFNQHSYDYTLSALKKSDGKKWIRFCWLKRGAGVEYPVRRLACELDYLVRLLPETTDFSLHQTAH